VDPISIAIIAAISAGLVKGVSTVGENVLVDAYEGLKSLIKRKFGHESDVAKAVDAVEAKPDSAGRQQTLSEEIVAAKADQDAEIVKAAQALQDLIKSLPSGGQNIQQAQGSYIAQAQDHSTSSVNIGTPNPNNTPKG